MTGIKTGAQDIWYRLTGLAKVVLGVGVIPEDAKVRSGFHVGESTGHFFTVSDACRVAVARDTPNPLDGRICGQGFDMIHIWPIVIHLYIHQFKTKVRCNFEVAVVAGRGAQEADGALLAPGLVAARYTEQDCSSDGVVHHGEAAVPPHNDRVTLTAQNFSKKLFHRGQTINAAVVTTIRIVLVRKLTGPGQGKERICQIQLLRRRFTASHIQGKPRFGRRLIAAAQLFFARFECFLTVFVKHDLLQGRLKFRDAE